MFGPAVGVDPPHTAVAAEPADWQLAGRRTEEAGGVPHVPAQAQAPTCWAEGQARDQLQHSTDQAATE